MELCHVIVELASSLSVAPLEKRIASSEENDGSVDHLAEAYTLRQQSRKGPAWDLNFPLLTSYVWNSVQKLLSKLP